MLIDLGLKRLRISVFLLEAFQSYVNKILDDGMDQNLEKRLQTEINRFFEAMITQRKWAVINRIMDTRYARDTFVNSSIIKIAVSRQHMNIANQFIAGNIQRGMAMVMRSGDTELLRSLLNEEVIQKLIPNHRHMVVSIRETKFDVLQLIYQNKMLQAFDLALKYKDDDLSYNILYSDFITKRIGKSRQEFIKYCIENGFYKTGRFILYNRKNEAFFDLVSNNHIRMVEEFMDYFTINLKTRDNALLAASQHTAMVTYIKGRSVYMDRNRLIHS
jgi:hypothetical protein